MDPIHKENTYADCWVPVCCINWE